MTTTENAAPASLIRFTAGSVPMERYSWTGTVSNLAGATSFPPIQLRATGWVRRIDMDFEVQFACASAAALASTGDAPFNLISSISLTDPTGAPIYTPISGYMLYLINKYLPNGAFPLPSPRSDATFSPEYDYSVAGGTSGTARFRLSLDLEVDAETGYGCIPNLDANASLTLQVNVAPYTVAFAGTTVSASDVSMYVTQSYWTPTGGTMGAATVASAPPGAGDFLSTAVQSKTVNAQSENLAQITNVGGILQGMIVVSRSAGNRVALTAGSNVGYAIDNYDYISGVPLEQWNDKLRRQYGYLGADRAVTPYVPLTTKGAAPGLDTGVLVFPFCNDSGTRDTWRRLRTGQSLEVRLTPGASATQLQVITRTMNVRDAAAFYAR